MLRALSAFAAALFLAAPLAAQEAADPPPDPACPQGDLAAPRGPGTICVGQLTGAYAFSIVYPAEAAAIPALAALLHYEVLRAERWLREQKGEAPGRISYEAEWRVDAMTPELIALSGTVATYAGGAHGGIEYRTILFDRGRDRAMRFGDLFRVGPFEHDLLGERPRGLGAVQHAFCGALAAEVRARRDEAKPEIRCPDVDAQPVTLLCGPRGRIEAMRALIAPYVVGSWAEGPYEVDIPVDARMISAMERRFRLAFGLPQEAGIRTPARACR